MNALASVAAVLAAYLVGSLSFAVIVSRTMGLADPRSYGSKNPGATNVLRSGNKAAALLTLAFDALKGFVPVWLALAFGARLGLGEWTVAFVGLAAFLGHLWPVFFRFQGGKGVATALGVLVGFSLWLGLATGATWLIVAFFFRYSSLASLASALFAPVYYVMVGGIVWDTERSIAASIVVMSNLLAWRHKDNIVRLIKGTESRLGSKKAAPGSAAVAPKARRKRH